MLLLLVACGGETAAPPAATTSTAPAKPSTPPPPSANQARQIIMSSMEFGEYQFTDAAWSLSMQQQSQMNEQTRADVQDLQRAGWLVVDGTGSVMLAPKARNDRRFLMRPNGILDVVPLARKEMGTVTGVSSNPDGTATAAFTWRWIPNEVGAAFTRGTTHDRFAAPQTSHATLLWNGTAWTVLKISG
ncbi:MAG TPA: hypothetical protein VF824_05410 [Thermoanaerobaculia bacterium]